MLVISTTNNNRLIMGCSVSDGSATPDTHLCDEFLMFLALNNTYEYHYLCIHGFILLYVQSAQIWLGGLFTAEAYITAMRQHVARAKNWSLEELCLNVSDMCCKRHT